MMHAILVPGLHKRTGLWGYCASLNPFKPRIYFDPMVDHEPGGNALMYHEWAHAIGRHALVGIILLLCGVLPYVWWRRQAEVIADRFAFKHYPEEFFAFCLMHRHPTALWGKWLYGRTVEERYDRAARASRRRGR